MSYHSIPRAAPGVLSAVKTALSQYGTNQVTVVGHSLGKVISNIVIPVNTRLNVSLTFRRCHFAPGCSFPADPYPQHIRSGRPLWSS